MGVCNGQTDFTKRNLWPPHFRTFCELVEGEENKLTTFSTWTILLGCNESNNIFQQHLCKLGRSNEIFCTALPIHLRVQSMPAPATTDLCPLNLRLFLRCQFAPSLALLFIITLNEEYIVTPSLESHNSHNSHPHTLTFCWGGWGLLRA